MSEEKCKPKKVRSTIYLTLTLRKAVQTYCNKKHISMTDLVESLLSAAVGKN